MRGPWDCFQQVTEHSKQTKWWRLKDVADIQNNKKSGTANTVGSWLSGWEAHQTPKVAWKIWTNEQDVFLRMHVTHEPMQSIKPEQIQRVDPRGNFVRIGLNLSSSALLNLKPHLKACLHSQIIYWFDVVIGTIETQKEIQRRLQAVLPDQDAILGQRRTDKQLKSLLAFAIQLSWGGLFNWGLCDWNGPPWAQVFLFFCRARSCTYWSDIIHPRAEGTKDLAQDLKIRNLRNWKRSRRLSSNGKWWTRVGAQERSSTSSLLTLPDCVSTKGKCRDENVQVLESKEKTFCFVFAFSFFSDLSQICFVSFLFVLVVCFYLFVTSQYVTSIQSIIAGHWRREILLDLEPM